MEKLSVVPEALVGTRFPESLPEAIPVREHRAVFGEIPKGCNSVLLHPSLPGPHQPPGTSRRVRAMRMPLALLPSALGSTSWGLRWNFSPHSRGAAAPACTSTAFPRAVLIISSVSRFLGLGASRKREKSSQQESAKAPWDIARGQGRVRAVSVYESVTSVGVQHL